MKLPIRWVAAVALFSATADAAVNVRVATFNIQTLEASFDTQFNAAVDVLNRICADVVVVNEIIDSTAYANLAAAAGYPHFVLASASNAVDFNLHNGVLSKYPISSSSTQSAVTLSGDATAMDLTRNFIVAEIAVPGASTSLVMIGNHWKSGGTEDDAEFRRSIESIRALQVTSAYNSAVVPYLVMGDMNDDILDSTDSPMQFVALPGGLPASFELGNDMIFPIPNGVFRPMQNAVGSQALTVLNPLQLDGSDATRNSSGRRLDYIWRSQAVTVIATEVYDSADEGIGGGLGKCGSPPASGTSAAASDHLAVFADISIPSGPPGMGACCNAGVCTNALTAAACSTGGGAYQGDNTNCSTINCNAASPVQINEIRIDQTGTDNDEYVELSGPPGFSLSGLTYLVIGDNSAGSDGVIEAVVNLSGSIPASGFFLMAENTYTLGGTVNLVTTLDFENTDNVTHMLVTGFTGANGNDLDTNDDCALDTIPWVTVIDKIAVILQNNPPTTSECHYGPPTIGPDGGSAPGHVYRCPDNAGAWLIGSINTVGGVDSPGASNPCPGACCVTGSCSQTASSGACSALGGVYQGYQVTCGQVSCPIFGACCTQGVCSDGVTAAACADNGGTYQGDLTDCDTTECPTGACCISGACFDDRVEATCIIDSGAYQGDGSTCAMATCPAGAVLNEVRVDQPTTNDDDEYFELTGPPGTTLDGVTYIVIGDGAGGSGVIEAIVELGEHSIPADGFFVATETTFTLAAPDMTTVLNFENADNVTHMLVLGFTGNNSQDLDTNDDGVLDVSPWTAILSCVALRDTATGGDRVYCPQVAGPADVPPLGLAFRCLDVTGNWRVGAYDPIAGDDTPGTANNCPIGACCLLGQPCEEGVVDTDCADPGEIWSEGLSCSQAACPAIPTVGQWSCAVLVLLLITSGTIVFARRTVTRPG